MIDHPLSKYISLPWLRHIAGNRFFKRGEDYFNDGRVTLLHEENDVISAEVEGTEDYRVDFWEEHGLLTYDCSCPVGDDDLFCKHCVATGLAWLAEQKALAEKPKNFKTPKKTPLTLKGIRRFLDCQEKETLVDLLVAQAKKDKVLREQFFLKIASTSAEGINLTALKKAIDRAVKIRDFVDYYEADAYTQKVQSVVEAVATLLKEGQANAVIELSEYALKALEKAIESIDDSDGGMSDLLYQFQEIHLSACKAGTPDPEALAARLFHWELTGDYDVFFDAALVYAEILGEKGLAVYRKCAEAKWDKIKTLGPNEEDRDQYGTRFRITHIMEGLAKATGDIEALVTVKRRDLSSAYNFLEIAKIYQGANQDEQALQWAEQGRKAFPETDYRLLEFLAEAYHRLNRREEAIQVIWTAFTEQPFLSRYQDLKKHAERNNQWSAYREKALAVIRTALDKAKQKTKKPKWRWQFTDHSELVKIFLWEKEVELAWNEAKTGECSDDLWMKLADLRQETHPDESLIIYQHQIAPTIERTNNQAYDEATRLLLKICKLMVRLERAEEFTSYLESIRTNYKRKRNFMKLLDKTKWET